MTLYITVDEVRSLVAMKDAVDALDEAFHHWHDAGTDNLPRRRLGLPAGHCNIMAASYPSKGVYGYRTYAIVPGGSMNNSTVLHDIKGGPPIAIIETGSASTTRTGAATGVATRYMAREDAKTVGLIGTGRQAVAQLEALKEVKTLERVAVYSRTKEKREAFAARMAGVLGVKVEPAASAQEAVKGADIVVTATMSSEPVFFADWIEPGMHINIMGTNSAHRREADDKTILRADVLVTDHRLQATIEAGELIELAASGRLDWNDVAELGDVVSGRIKGRSSRDDVTVFKSLGLAYEDVAFCKLIYDRARAKGVGRELPIGN